MLFLLGFISADRPAAVVALADNGTSDPMAVLVNYGALGIFIIALATGTFRTKYEVQRLERQVEQLRSDLAGKDELIRAFQLQLTGHALPALARTAQVFEAIPATRTDIEELKRARDEAAALAQQLQALSRGESPQ